MDSFRPIDYATARDLIRCGDIALCGGYTLMSEGIKRITKSRYTHATMLGRFASQDSRNDVVMIGDTMQHHGARIRPLSQEVSEWPGLYDVYRVYAPGFDGDAAWAFMLRASGCRYGWGCIAAVWARRRLGRIVPTALLPRNSDIPQTRRDCSALVHACLRNGGGPQRETLDCLVTPGDLAAIACYQFTLFMHSDQYRSNA
jgi:hypothetical protein